MKLSKPEDMDEVEESPAVSDMDTVVMFGEETPIDNAVQALTEIVEQPDNFGLVSESRLVESEERVLELEERNENLRRDVAVLWEYVTENFVDRQTPSGEKAIPVDSESGAGPLSFDVYDPTREFDEWEVLENDE